MRAIVVGLTLFVLVLGVAPRPRGADVDFSTVGRLPLAFEPGTQGDFIARGPGYMLSARPAGIALRLHSSGHTVRMDVIGANRDASLEAVDRLEGKSHYLKGNDPAAWRCNVGRFARLRCRDVYPGIDLEYYGNEGRLEYDFILAPGTDPNEVQLRFKGADRLEITSDGDLLVHVGTTHLRQLKPIAYQLVGDQRTPVDAAYALHGQGAVGLRIGAYDRSRALVIDPVLVYSSYLGGSGFDNAYAVAVDAAGAIYLAGVTDSIDFPTANALRPNPASDHDVFVAKLNPAGTAIIFVTYLGGVGEDRAQGVAVDATGAVYVAGFTRSTDFPTANAIQGSLKGLRDGFVARIAPSGDVLEFSTYLGGSAIEEITGLAIDATGNAYVVGRTFSVDFPTVGPLQPSRAGPDDFFISKLSPSGATLVYSTYLGGSSSEQSTGIAVDPAGHAYVTGVTQSGDFPTVNAIQGSFGGGIVDAVLAKLSPSGASLVYATYLGGGSNDDGLGVAAAADGTAYLVGGTRSANFPLLDPIQSSRAGDSDAFVARVDPSGGLVFSTLLGGSGKERFSGVAIGNGRIYVSGDTTSNDLPLVDAVQMTLGGGFDGLVAALDMDGSSLLLSTYLGGSANELFNPIALGPTGDVVVAGNTTSVDFPVVAAFQSGYGGGTLDAVVARLGDNQAPIADAGENFVILSEEQSSTGIAGIASDPDGTPVTCTWREGSNVLVGPVEVTGGTCDLDLGSLPPLSLGDHTFALEVTDGLATSTDQVVVTVDNSPPIAAPSGAGVYQIDAEVVLGGQVSDHDGDVLTALWRKAGTPLFPVEVVGTTAGGAPVALAARSIAAQTLGLGVHVIELAVDDGVNDEVVTTIEVEIIDSTAPTLAPIPSTTILWPPNHEMVEVTIQANAADNSGLPLALSVEIESNEAADGDGDGNTQPDFEVLDVDSETGVVRVNLRAERSAKGDGRVYTVTLMATDTSGNAAEATIAIIAPHSKGRRR